MSICSFDLISDFFVITNALSSYNNHSLHTYDTVSQDNLYNDYAICYQRPIKFYRFFYDLRAQPLGLNKTEDVTASMVFRKVKKLNLFTLHFTRRQLSIEYNTCINLNLQKSHRF